MKRETDRPDRIGPYRVLDVLGKGAMDNAPLLTELAALLETSGRGDEAARLHARADFAARRERPRLKARRPCTT